MILAEGNFVPIDSHIVLERLVLLCYFQTGLPLGKDIRALLRAAWVSITTSQQIDRDRRVDCGGRGLELAAQAERQGAIDTLLEQIAEQLRAALESARLYEDVQRTAARERLTREITDELHRVTATEGIVQTAVDTRFKMSGMSRAFGQLEAAPLAPGCRQ
jgi:predicted TIM-barrel enzyme